MELAEKIAALFRSGPFVQFHCDPSALFAGSQRPVTIEAVVFLAWDALKQRASWKPLVTCKEVPGLTVSLAQDSSAVRNTLSFRGTLLVSALEAGRYTLHLHPHSGQTPLASLTLLIVDKSAAREIERTLLGV